MDARHSPGKFNGLANFVVNELSDLFLLDFMSASNVTVSMVTQSNPGL
jgi:hypothetical protein